MDICDFANAIPVAARRLAKEVVGAIFVAAMPPSNSLANFKEVVGAVFVAAMPPSNSLANFTMVEDIKDWDGEEKSEVDTRYFEVNIFSGGKTKLKSSSHISP